MPTLDQVRAVLYDHYPEWLTGTCLCGADVPVYQTWIDHVMSKMEGSNGT